MVPLLNTSLMWRRSLLKACSWKIPVLLCLNPVWFCSTMSTKTIITRRTHYRKFILCNTNLFGIVKANRGLPARLSGKQRHLKRLFSGREIEFYSGYGKVKERREWCTPTTLPSYGRGRTGWTSSPLSLSIRRTWKELYSRSYCAILLCDHKSNEME